MEEEVWLPVPGYEQYYQVSNMGRIKSNRPWKGSHVAGGIMSLHKTRKGYVKVKFKVDGKKRLLFVHRLVGLAFIPNPENKSEINHKRGIKADNRATEIEWCTQEENYLHAVKIGLNVAASDRNKGERSNTTPHNAIPIINIITGESYSSKLRVIKKYRISEHTLNKILKNQSGKFKVINNNNENNYYIADKMRKNAGF